MKLQLKAKHFVDTNYSDWNNCAIAKAAKETFPGSTVSENVDSLLVTFPGSNVKWWQFWKTPQPAQTKIFKHKSYSPIDFYEDQSVALDRANPESKIREIELVES